MIHCYSKVNAKLKAVVLILMNLIIITKIVQARRGKYANSA